MSACMSRGCPGRVISSPAAGTMRREDGEVPSGSLAPTTARCRGRACPISDKIIDQIYAGFAALLREERGHLGYSLATRFSEIDGQRVPVRHRRRQRQRWIDGLAQLMQRETELPPPAGDLMAWGTSIPRGKYRGLCG